MRDGSRLPAVVQQSMNVLPSARALPRPLRARHMHRLLSTRRASREPSSAVFGTSGLACGTRHKWSTSADEPENSLRADVCSPDVAIALRARSARHAASIDVPRGGRGAEFIRSRRSANALISASAEMTVGEHLGGAPHARARLRLSPWYRRVDLRVQTPRGRRQNVRADGRC